MAKKQQKTNVMRVLDAAKISYNEYTFEGEYTNGVEIAEAMGQPVERVFKTLVTAGKSGRNFVFMVPVAEELDLKKAAKAVGEKSIAMIKSKELLPLTGYIHGGCSPIGMKKQFETVIHETAQTYDTIFFSGGRIGFQVELAPDDLFGLIPIRSADLIV
ncbi:Cys-tRNA(Pro)/Cys-tRNA(Cys) deacylase [Ruminococcus sp. YE71]|uniref:Cys-tRNA(Pro) deacylase n=1 Tax=unclassified Ruminococcus TaxID=2608920 RepID=UPI00087ECB2A|nr:MULTISPECIES: Cys-tRNA(Pro) deacylase [unclassified Ruminococcus]SDA16106.1 Cys-tRNA(Pro)/Cys-tRNA(Cys) deacylase [Ruminococcus sp. YE78]SFW23942.1 Cys-tRNA(Pro)/Cys-tRNA(Cys) deacylase [Ruminococcus sp. YE71]